MSSRKDWTASTWCTVYQANADLHRHLIKYVLRHVDEIFAEDSPWHDVWAAHASKRQVVDAQLGCALSTLAAAKFEFSSASNPGIETSDDTMSTLLRACEEAARASMLAQQYLMSMALDIKTESAELSRQLGAFDMTLRQINHFSPNSPPSRASVPEPAGAGN